MILTEAQQGERLERPGVNRRKGIFLRRRCIPIPLTKKMVSFSYEADWQLRGPKTPLTGSACGIGVMTKCQGDGVPDT